MKKIFTLAAALMASLTMMAQTITISTATAEGNWYGVEGVGRVANKSGNAWASPDLTCEGSTGYKTGSSYFTIQTYQGINALTIWARSSSNRTIDKIYVSEDLQSSAQSASNVEYTVVNENSEDYAIVKNACDNEFTITFNEAVAADSYIQIVLSGNADIVAVTFVAGEIVPSTDPVASVVIAGPEAVYVGRTASFSATTDVKANAYKWFVNGVEQDGATAKTFDFTPTEAGNYSISCSAKNDYNTDFVASDAIALVATEKPILEQVPVSEATVWDFSKAATVSQIKWEGADKDAAPIVMANIDDFNNNDEFNSQALLFSGEYPIRDGKYCQGPLLKFNTTVAGYVSIVYSNTGNRSAAEGETEGQEALRRFLAINGALVAGDKGSMKSNQNTVTNNIPVAAGDVEISARMPYGATPENAEYIRIYKVQFSLEQVATAISNTNANVKAVKVVRNGQLFIEKNGVVYNAQGAIVK